MEHTQNYIQWIRSKVGHEKIILVLPEAVFAMKREKSYFREEQTAPNGVSPAVLLNLENHWKMHLKEKSRKKQILIFLTRSSLI